MRPRRKSSGFTLVELLVVIAIIGILAGFIAVGLPKALELAKLSALKSNFRQIQTTLASYYVEHGSFPPSYGYLSPAFIDNRSALTTANPGLLNPQTRAATILNLITTNQISQSQAYFLLPWMSFVREHANQKLHDNFSRSLGYDTDADGNISRLEFAPRGVFDQSTQSYAFNYTTLYRGNNGNDPANASDSATRNDVSEQRATQEPRPFIYVAVNDRQFKQFRKIIYDMAIRQGNQNEALPFNLDPTAITQINTQLSFPPPSYDAFVLMSVGPMLNTGTSGLVAEFDNVKLRLSDFPEVNQYHILGLATYFLATRDSENGGKGDGELDFDYTARKSGGQRHPLPGQFPNTGGPVIFVGLP